MIFPRQIAPSLFDALVSAYHAGGDTLRIAQQAIQMQTIVNLVSGGMGVAWVPESLTHLQRRRRVRYARVTGLRRPGAALRVDQPGTVARRRRAGRCERFVEHVKSHGADPGSRRVSAEPNQAR